MKPAAPVTRIFCGAAVGEVSGMVGKNGYSAKSCGRASKALPESSESMSGRQAIAAPAASARGHPLTELYPRLYQIALSKSLYPTPASSHEYPSGDRAFSRPYLARYWPRFVIGHRPGRSFRRLQQPLRRQRLYHLQPRRPIPRQVQKSSGTRPRSPGREKGGNGPKTRVHGLKAKGATLKQEFYVLIDPWLPLKDRPLDWKQCLGGFLFIPLCRRPARRPRLRQQLSPRLERPAHHQ